MLLGWPPKHHALALRHSAASPRLRQDKVAPLTCPWVTGVAGSATRCPLSTVPVVEVGSVDWSGDGVRKASVWARLLGVERTVIEQIEFDDEEELVICHVRPVKAERRRCGICRWRCGGYDAGVGRRRWRALDLGTRSARCWRRTRRESAAPITGRWSRRCPGPGTSPGTPGSSTIRWPAPRRPPPAPAPADHRRRDGHHLNP
jgi:hypothetical protein